MHSDQDVSTYLGVCCKISYRDKFIVKNKSTTQITTQTYETSESQIQSETKNWFSFSHGVAFFNWDP